MRILITFVLMSMVAMIATIVIVVQAVVSLLPWLVGGLALVVLLRLLSGRRNVAGPAQSPVPVPPARPTPAARPAAVAAARPVQPRPVGWVLMPVWPECDAWSTPVAPRPGEVVDGEVIGEVRHG